MSELSCARNPPSGTAGWEDGRSKGRQSGAHVSAFGAAVDGLVDMLAAAIGDAGVVQTALPEAVRAPERPSVSVLLQSAVPRTVARGTHETACPVDLSLVVAVTAAGDEQADLLHDCWQAILAAGSAAVIDTEAIEPAWWLAMGATPRPAFRVRTPALIALPIQAGPPVTEPLIVEHEPGDPSALRRQHAEAALTDHTS